jgi:hypothetical protein
VKRSVLGTAAGLGGAAIGIGASKLFGAAALLFPGVFGLAAAALLVKVGPKHARPFAAALSVLAGHLGWMTAGRAPVRRVRRSTSSCARSAASPSATPATAARRGTWRARRSRGRSSSALRPTRRLARRPAVRIAPKSRCRPILASVRHAPARRKA